MATCEMMWYFAVFTAGSAALTLWLCACTFFSRGASLDQEVLDSVGLFIVEDMEFWIVSCCFQFGVNAGGCLHHAGMFPQFHGA